MRVLRKLGKATLVRVSLLLYPLFSFLLQGSEAPNLFPR